MKSGKVSKVSVVRSQKKSARRVGSRAKSAAKASGLAAKKSAAKKSVALGGGSGGSVVGEADEDYPILTFPKELPPGENIGTELLRIGQVCGGVNLRELIGRESPAQKSAAKESAVSEDLAVLDDSEVGDEADEDYPILTFPKELPPGENIGTELLRIGQACGGVNLRKLIGRE